MSKQRLLLIGWDGADWKVAGPLMEQGQMPQLSNIVKNGASGNLASFPPYLSPMLWNTIATGKRPHKHGICGFSEVSEESGRVRPVSSRSRQCKAIWNILTEQDHSCHVLGWFASHPAERIRGTCVSEEFARPSGKIGGDWPVPRASVYPPERALDLEAIRVAPESVDKVLLDFLMPRYREVEGPMVRRVDQLLVRLSELYSIHNAAIDVVENDGDFTFFGVYYHFLDWICHDFMEFHPPRRDHIAAEHYELFKDVVANAYRLQDLLLRDLLSRAGHGTAVMIVSDHGFQSDHQRPKINPNVTAGIASWHRRYGLIAAAGPCIRKNTTITGASLVDIAPSILHYFGLPVGKDMDGRVLEQLFENTGKISYIDSWETEAPINDQNLPETEPWAEEDEAKLLNQFEKLGYIDSISSDSNFAALETCSNNAWNLGVALRAVRMNEEALPYLEEAYFYKPDHIATANQLAQCQLALGMLESAEETVQCILDLGNNRPMANLLMATVEHLRGDFEAAWEYLERVEDQEENRFQLVLRRGYTLIGLKEYEAANVALEKAVSYNAEDPSVHLGRAQALFGLQRFDEAAEAAEQAVALEYEMLEAHLALGMISECREDWQKAEIAYHSALAMRPDHPGALFRISELAARGTPNYQEDLLKRQEEFEAMLIKRKEENTPRTRSLEAAAEKRFEALVAKRSRRRSSMTPVDYLEGKELTKIESSAKTFVIVSGLPRSGTSLMMQMLAKGGLEVITDGIREADTHNPKGYLEWEAIKSLKDHPKIIEEAEGKVAKIVSVLLPYLPAEHEYKILFMDRDLDEVAASQEKMLYIDDQIPLEKEKAKELLANHKTKILKMLEACPNISCMRIDYADLLCGNASSIAEAIKVFLHPGYSPSISEMMAAIDPNLYRQKQSS